MRFRPGRTSYWRIAWSHIVDRCANYYGMWFDIGEAEQLKAKWMSDYIDSGDRAVGREHNKMRDIGCPRCGKPMKKLNDPLQRHIQYAACEEHGMYFDAGGFTDCKYETLIDISRDFVSLVRYVIGA